MLYLVVCFTVIGSRMSRPSAIPVTSKNLVGKRRENKPSNVIIFSFLLTIYISLSFPFLSLFFSICLSDKY